MFSLLLKKFPLAVFAALMVAFIFNCETSSSDEPESKDVTLSDGDKLQGTYSKNVTVEADVTITLSGVVKFEKGYTLTIKEGVTVKGDTSKLSYLIIDRGAKIEAVGTAAKPVVFTSDKTAGGRAPGDWGGIVINGYAPINNGSGTPPEADGEGDSGKYGGNKADDNSGTLKYVRIEFAGKIFSGTDELNALALQGVGSGTTVEYVQLHKGSDDGIEMFGGTVNLKYIIASENEDDQIDFTGGWTGMVQWAVSAPRGKSDSGIEGDGNSKAPAATPLSTPVFFNYTFVRGDGADKKGARFKAGAQPKIYSSYFNGLDAKNIVTDDSATGTVVKVWTSALSHGTGITQGSSTTITLNASVTKDTGTATALPKTKFATGTTINAASFTPASAVTFGTAKFPTTANNDSAYNALTTEQKAFFIKTDYVGAVKDDAGNWLKNWTAFPAN